MPAPLTECSGYAEELGSGLAEQNFPLCSGIWGFHKTAGGSERDNRDTAWRILWEYGSRW